MSPPGLILTIDCGSIKTGRRKIGGTVNIHIIHHYPLESFTIPLSILSPPPSTIATRSLHPHPTPIPQVHCCDVYHGCEEVQAEVAYVLGGAPALVAAGG